VKKRILIGVALATAMAAGGASAHHSFAMFDMKATVTLDGTVKDFQWQNPHSWIVVDAAGPDGKMAEWKIEASSPAQLGRRGWKKSSVKAGDKISIVIHPMKTGEHGGAMVKTVINGKLVGDENAGGEQD
jgi:hypothetical protein